MVSRLPSDPSHVIGLFPDLLPQQYWNQLEYPDSLPDLQGRDMENGLVALADYLTQVTLPTTLHCRLPYTGNTADYLTQVTLPTTLHR